MKYIIKENKEFLLAFFGTLFLILSCSVFVSNANIEVQELVIKSMTPIYNEESTVSVDNTNVIFNDKNQVVKYNVLVENTQSYDVKITDIKFTTPTEEFLKYTVENVELDDVIKANETKELVVSFETVKMDGWGRNFSDELVTTIVFDKVVATEEVIPPVVEPEQDNKDDVTTEEPNEEQPKEEIPDTNENNNVEIDNNNQPENNEVTNNTPSVEEPKEEVKEDVNDEVVPSPETSDINNEIGVEEVVKNDNGDLVVIFAFGIATGVFGIGLIMVNKNKFAKYIVVFVILGSSLKIGFADEVIDLDIPVNVSYESQNVMLKFVDENGNLLNDFKQLFPTIKNYYIQNDISEIHNYIDKIDLSNEQNERVVLYTVANSEDANFVDVYLQADGVIYPNENASRYFAEMTNLDKIENLAGFDTCNVKNMSYMFLKTGYNSEVFTMDVSNFDTSNVINMRNMFAATGNGASNFVLDVSNFDTSQVTNMSAMFYHTGSNNKTFTLDVSNFDTSNVTDMSSMFSCTGYKSTVFNLNVSNFDTSNVTNMSYMFNGTGYKSVIFSLDVSKFNMDKVTDTSGMFREAGYESGKLNTSIIISKLNVDTYSKMFEKVAIKDGAQITVNYTTETEDIVDQMILTKSENSNVVKGFNVDNIISFRIDGVIYNAYEGMTWWHWVNSNFNTGGYKIVNEAVWANEDTYVGLQNSNEYLTLNDLIHNDYDYAHKISSPI